jgi:hypothetical protein
MMEEARRRSSKVTALDVELIAFNIYQLRGLASFQ